MLRVLRRAGCFALVAVLAWLVVGCSKSLPSGNSVPTVIPGSSLHL